MRLAAGVQRSSPFGEDIGIEHPFADSLQCSNIGPLNPIQENAQQNLLLPTSTDPLPLAISSSKEPNDTTLQP